MDTYISGDNFADGLARVFTPYKGYTIYDGDKRETDVLTIRDRDTGPLKIVVDTLSHGNWHNLDNLVDIEGKKILPKGVRKITHCNNGYYIVYDNNEDELINSGEVIGGFRADKYKEYSNVVFYDGHLLSDSWFDKIYSYNHGYFLAETNGLFILIDKLGKTLHRDFMPYLTAFDGKKAYALDGCRMYEITPGKITLLKKLNPIDCELKFNDRIRIFKNNETKKMTLITSDGYQVFGNWYDRIIFTYTVGMFIVAIGNDKLLINLNEENVLGQIFDEIYSISVDLTIVRKDGKYVIFQNNIAKEYDFDSFMWHNGSLWNLEMQSGDEYKRYFHGEGSALIAYAHEVLVSNPNAIFIGKDGLWSYYNGRNEPKPLFKYRP